MKRYELCLSMVYLHSGFMDGLCFIHGLSRFVFYNVCLFGCVITDEPLDFYIFEWNGILKMH
jgi:hypothetical protein